jgi:hypothetical protein
MPEQNGDEAERAESIDEWGELPCRSRLQPTDLQLDERSPGSALFAAKSRSVHAFHLPAAEIIRSSGGVNGRPRRAAMD